MSSLTSFYLDEKARNSKVMQDTALKVEKRNDEKRSRHFKILDSLRVKIIKEKELHELSILQSPNYEMQRRIRAVETTTRDAKLITDVYKSKKIGIDEHFDKRIQDAIERLNKERDEAHVKLEAEYNGDNGVGGKISNAVEKRDSCIQRLEEEKKKMPQKILALEFDYKKALQDYNDEFHDKPPYYFKFLENNSLPKDALEEEKPEIEEVNPAIAAIFKMMAENAIYQQQSQEKLEEQHRQEQEEQPSYSNTRYGYISEIEKKPTPVIQEQVSEKIDIASFTQPSVPPPVPVPALQEQKKKKSSVVARQLQEKQGAHTYGLPK